MKNTRYPPQGAHVQHQLAPKFSGDTFTYTLTVPEGTTLVTPTAANKNYRSRRTIPAIPRSQSLRQHRRLRRRQRPTMNEKRRQRTYTISVTLPAGTEVTADSFEITLSDSKATLTGPAKG